MEHSKTAIADCLIDNDRVRVTQYRFSPGSETKWHLHEWDYIVIPQTDWELLLVDAEGQEQNATLTQGVPYYRKAGVEHNVINAGTRELIFTEVEMKAHPIEDDPDGPRWMKKPDLKSNSRWEALFLWSPYAKFCSYFWSCFG